MNKEIEELLNTFKELINTYSPDTEPFTIDYDYEIKYSALESLLSYIEQLQTNVKDCKQKLEQYENPDDLTLFYMWLDTKTKDKMKQMEAEITHLKQQNSMITKLGEQLQNNRDKAIEYIEKYKREGMGEEWFETSTPVSYLLKTLKGDSDENIR